MTKPADGSTTPNQTETTAFVCKELCKSLLNDKILPEADINITREDVTLSLSPEFVWGRRDTFVGGSIESGRYLYKHDVTGFYSRETTFKKLGYLSSLNGKGEELRFVFGGSGAWPPDGIGSHFDLLASFTTKVGKDGRTGDPYVGALFNIGASIHIVRPDPWEKSSGFFLRFEPNFGIGGGADIRNGNFKGYFDIEGQASLAGGVYF